MHRRAMMTTLAGATVLAASMRGTLAQTPPAQVPPAQVPSAQVPPAQAPSAERAGLETMLQPYLGNFGLPALAAAVVKAGVTVAAGAVGTRRIGFDLPVTIEDRFHIGSDTKGMTALLAAIYIEAGKLRFDSRLGEVFPELARRMHPVLRGVTLEQLLSHTSGVPSDNDAIVHLIERSFTLQDRNLDELRLWMLTQWSGKAPTTKPGTTFAYSNLGYTFAAAMIERVGGRTWEELIAPLIFDSLELRSAGFGPQASLGRIDAPLGHQPLPDATLKPMLAGPNGDVPAIYGPAGDVHLSVLDFARWAGWNAGEGRRGPALVSPQTLRKLHTPVIEMAPRPDAATGTPAGGRYGLGWGVVNLAFSPEPFVFHGGSNGMNLAYVMLQPERDFALVMLTNVGGQKADDALKALSKELYERYGATP
ncbi:CubicO group peptidase, beta-lactamase class C family [Rhizobiales bacterium GAS191]|nr:CubicO group peptidase, beta-lactamase class C family [Rhizobiales bacterium GAS191]